jgi:hypothetical protein
MNLIRREEYKTLLLDLIPSDGKAISNPTAREALKAQVTDDQISDEDYFDLRNSLIADGKLEKARGRGGMVRRILTVAEPIPTATEPVVAPIQAVETKPSVNEIALYEPFLRVIQTGYVLDNDLNRWVCEITAAQGRRNTGGKWTRPDITLISEQTFIYVPGKVFDVITFEIKPDIDSAMEGVYEAAAHGAFAHRSYLAFPDSDEYDDSPLFDRIVAECERFGIGLILFENVANWDTYDFQVSAERGQPDPQSVNEFIKVQISEKGREEIMKWLH